MQPTRPVHTLKQLESFELYVDEYVQDVRYVDSLAPATDPESTPDNPERPSTPKHADELEIVEYIKDVSLDDTPVLKEEKSAT